MRTYCAMFFQDPLPYIWRPFKNRMCSSLVHPLLDGSFGFLSSTSFVLCNDVDDVARHKIDDCSGVGGEEGAGEDGDEDERDGEAYVCTELVLVEESCESGEEGEEEDGECVDEGVASSGVILLLLDLSGLPSREWNGHFVLVPNLWHG